MNTSESTKDSWTHGDLNGVWLPNVEDINAIYPEYTLDIPGHGLVSANDIVKAYFYSCRDMTLPMLSPDSLRYNIIHRARVYEKVLNFSWQENLLNAYHNLQFVCYMKDIAPEFGKQVEVEAFAGVHFSYSIGLLGQEIFLLQMLYETASEVTGAYFRKSEEECRISTVYIDSNDAFESQRLGLDFHVVGECVATIMLKFYPTYNPVEKRFSFGYMVDIFAEEWSGDPLPLSGPKAPATPYIGLLKQLRTAVIKKLDAFGKTLTAARFNQIQYMPDDMK